jgi:hypothetical protein
MAADRGEASVGLRVRIAIVAVIFVLVVTGAVLMFCTDDHVGSGRTLLGFAVGISVVTGGFDNWNRRRALRRR